MKTYITRFSIYFFNKKPYAGAISFLAKDEEDAQNKSFENVYQLIKDKAIDKGDHELDLFAGSKQIIITVELAK